MPVTEEQPWTVNEVWKEQHYQDKVAAAKKIH